MPPKTPKEIRSFANEIRPKEKLTLDMTVIGYAGRPVAKHEYDKVIAALAKLSDAFDIHVNIQLKVGK
jgi:hypothetical protein